MIVHLFGKFASAAGSPIEVAGDACSVAELRDRVSRMHPSIAEELDDRRVRAVVGDVFVDDDFRLKADDEIDFLAPVSGG